MQAPVERDPPQAAGSSEIGSRPGVFWWVLIVLVFVVGLAVRLYDLADPPLDFHATRQIHSALIARGMYYQFNDSIPDWQRDMAVMQWRTEGLIEPPVSERLAAWFYAIVGEPDLRIPRLFAILAWMIAAVFVIWLAVDMAGKMGGVVAALFFLTWPYGVVASRAFQPEPLLVALISATLWAAIRWARQSSWGWTIATGLLAGISIYIKSVAVFFVAPVLLTVVLSRGGLRNLRAGKVWVMAALAVAPYAIYHIDGVYLRGYLAGQFSERFFPHMWVDPAFYLRWIGNLGRTAPFELALLAVAGLFLLRRRLYRVLLLAVWVGYFLYGLALPHHISTHDYYHLLLYPAIALGLAGLGDALDARLRSLSGSGPTYLAFTAIFLAALVMNTYNARTTLKRFNASEQAQMWEEIGDLLGPGASAAALVPDYGVGLKYWGWINPALWLTTGDIAWRESLGEEVDFQAWFTEQAAGKDFFIVTLFDEFDRQPQLRDLLYSRYTFFHQGSDYMVFDLRSP